jgi:phospholipase C
MPAGLDNLKHIVVLMMENRSFDHMLGFANSAAWPIDGLAGDEKNEDSTGEPATVSSDASDSGDFTPDPGHALFDTLTQLYGDAQTPVSEDPSMNGFVLSYEGKTHNASQGHRIMKCFSPRSSRFLYRSRSNSAYASAGSPQCLGRRFRIVPLRTGPPPLDA